MVGSGIGECEVVVVRGVVVVGESTKVGEEVKEEYNNRTYCWNDCRHPLDLLWNNSKRPTNKGCV